MLIKCPECGSDVSDSAMKCPHCGKQLKKLKRGFFGKIFLWLFYLFNILMLLWVITGMNAASEVATKAATTLSSILINAHSREMAYFLHAGDDADKVIRSIFKGLNEGGKYNMWITFSKADDYKNSPYKYSIVIGEDGKVYQYPIIHNNTKFEVYYQPENGDSSFAFDATALIASEKIVVEDQVGSDILTFLNTISDVAPVITTTQLSTGTVGRSYQEILTSSGTTPIIWAIESNKLPDGLSLNTSTGQINGNPQTAGSFTFMVKAQNSVGSDAKEFTIKIDPAPTKPSITTNSLPNGTVGTPYGENISFTGTEPIAWSVTNGELPDNLNLVNGRISGRPTRADTYTFTVQASNRAGSDTKTFTIKISDKSSENESNIGSHVSDERAERIRTILSRNANTQVQRLSSENARIASTRQLSQTWKDNVKEKVIAVIPECQVFADGIYLFDVLFDENVSSGSRLTWHAFSDSVSIGSFFASANETDSYVFLDDADNEIEMPITEAIDHVIVAAYLEAYTNYAPVITSSSIIDSEDNSDKDKTGGNSDKNSPQETNDGDNSTNSSNSGGGGCDSALFDVLSLFTIPTFPLLFRALKKKK